MTMGNNTIKMETNQIVSSGKTGDCTWSLSGTTLTISGNGKMGDSWDAIVPSLNNITSVVISDGVTSISDYAFADCTSLTSVTIPQSVSSIGSYAFSVCYRLTSITIPDGVTKIGDWAFYRCTGIKSVYITDISKWCNINFARNDANPLCYEGHLYLNGKEIKDLVIPDNVTSISHRAFEGCSGLTSVTIPNSVTNIGDDAFYGCENLTSVTIGNGVTEIGDDAFTCCYELKNVYITDIAKWCGIEFGDAGSNPLCDTTEHLYLNGKEITDLVIPDGVTSISDDAFSGCSVLTSVTIPDGVTSIGSYAFSNCTGLTSVTIPDSVTSIGDYAFYCCVNLPDVDIPASAIIGEEAFRRYKIIHIFR